MNLLTIQDLSIMHRQTSLLHDIHMHINSGEIVALVGATGSGKSLFAKALLGLLPKTMLIQGSIVFDGKELKDASAQEMRTIRGQTMSLILQESSLNPSMRILHQLLESVYIARPHLTKKEAKERVYQLLHRVHLEKEIAKAYPHMLSGGMKQRIAIAQAIFAPPKLLIADESTTALDMTVQAEILCLLHDLRQTYHISILFITHDLSLVRNFCDRVLVLHEGSIVEAASVQEIFLHPQHSYTRSLLL